MREQVKVSKPSSTATVRAGGPSIRPRLIVGAPGDRWEQEADRVADRVMHPASPTAQTTTIPASPAALTTTIQRKCACSKDGDELLQRSPIEGGDELLQRSPIEGGSELLQRSPTGGGAATVSPAVRASIDSMRAGGGAPLHAATRGFMQERLGHDFSHVRVHTDTRAAHSAAALWARAFTVGRDVFFNTGQYAPETDAGRRLIAHELAHVVQQGAGAPVQVQRQATGGDTSGKAEVEKLSQYEIAKQWKAKKAQFIAVASAPNNLSGHQLFAIWHSYWIEMQNLAVDEEKRLRDKAWSADRVAYAENIDLFRLGKRDALGPDYQAAADRLDATNFMLSGDSRLLNWLEDWVDTGQHHILIRDVNDKAIEIAKAQAMFQSWFAPIIYGALGMAQGGAPSVVAAEEGALIEEPTTTITRPTGPPNLRVIQGQGGTTSSATGGRTAPVRTGSGARGATAAAPKYEEAPAPAPTARPSLTLVPEEAPAPAPAPAPTAATPRATGVGVSPALALALAQTYQNPDEVKSGPCNARDVKGHLGGNVAHNNFATTVTGGNPNDFRITTPEGWDCTTDGRDLRKPNVVWEVKVGHDWVSDTGVAGGSIDAPRLMKRLLGLEKQRIDCSLAAARCGYEYRYAVDSLEVAQALNTQWKGIPPVYCFNRDGTPCKH